MLLLAALALAVVAVASPVAAQPPDDALAGRLREVRLEHSAERERAGWMLLSWGVANAVGGGIAAGVGHDDPVVLTAGLTSAGWGVVNGLLSLFLLDLGGGRRREILQGRLGDTTEPEAVRRQAMVDQLRSGQIFALNLGLDVGYLVSGALLFALGRETDSDPLAAAGATIAAQGLVLFAFDLHEWLGANARAEELRTF